MSGVLANIYVVKTIEEKNISILHKIVWDQFNSEHKISPDYI